MYKDLYAFQFRPKEGEHVKQTSGWALFDSQSEYGRMGLPNEHWRHDAINTNYEAGPTVCVWGGALVQHILLCVDMLLGVPLAHLDLCYVVLYTYKCPTRSAPSNHQINSREIKYNFLVVGSWSSNIPLVVGAWNSSIPLAVRRGLEFQHSLSCT